MGAGVGAGRVCVKELYVQCNSDVAKNGITELSDDIQPIMKAQTLS